MKAILAAACVFVVAIFAALSVGGIVADKVAAQFEAVNAALPSL